jgi:predicted  nucleic acid-binding Zn-ribbon protein
MPTDQGTLKGLQELDLQITEKKKALAAFDPQLAEVDEPALALEQQVDGLTKRLQEIQTEERRLERAADDKRSRGKQLETRLQTVRNLREEAAVHAEQDLLRRALDADEQEALSLLDQIRRVEKQLEESEAALAEARAELEPARKALVEGRDEARKALDDLLARRESYAASVDSGPLRVYESIKAGGRGVVVSDLTGDGACGNCFSVIPLQVQNEIRSGAELIRCEGCGVILSDSAEDAAS